MKFNASRFLLGNDISSISDLYMAKCRQWYYFALQGAIFLVDPLKLSTGAILVSDHRLSPIVGIDVLTPGFNHCVVSVPLHSLPDKPTCLPPLFYLYLTTLTHLYHKGYIHTSSTISYVHFNEVWQTSEAKGRWMVQATMYVWSRVHEQVHVLPQTQAFCSTRICLAVLKKKSEAVRQNLEWKSWTWGYTCVLYMTGHIATSSIRESAYMFSDFRVADQMGVFKSGTLRMQAMCPVSTLGQR